MSSRQPAMAGMAYFVPRKTPLTLTAIMRSQSSSVVSSIPLRMRIPALFTRILSLPYLCGSVYSGLPVRFTW